MVNATALSTSDNPYNPFTQYEEWEAFDVLQGYNSSAYLDRIVLDSPDLSPEDQSFAIETAIDDIVAENLVGQATGNEVNYIKIKKV